MATMPRQLVSVALELTDRAMSDEFSLAIWHVIFGLMAFGYAQNYYFHLSAYTSVDHWD